MPRHSKKRSFLTTKRRRDGGAGDFKRRKAKVGRKLKPANVTDTSFKTGTVRLTEQRSLADKSAALVTRRNLDLHDLLKRVKHYDSTRRKDALWGLRELYATHGHTSKLLQRSLGIVFRSISNTMVDVEKDVRQALFTLLEVVLPCINISSMAAPFVQRLIAYCGSAMTSMEREIRMDAVRFVDLLLEWNRPSIRTTQHTLSLLPSLVSVLSSISLVNSTSSIQNQSRAFSVGGTALTKDGLRIDSGKKRRGAQYAADRRVYDVLRTIEKLVADERSDIGDVNISGVNVPSSVSISHLLQGHRTSALYFLDQKRSTINLQKSLTGCKDDTAWGVVKAPIQEGARGVNQAPGISAASAAIAGEDMYSKLLATMEVMWNDILEVAMRDGDSLKGQNHSAGHKGSSKQPERASTLIQSLGSILRVVGAVWSQHGKKNIAARENLATLSESSSTSSYLSYLSKLGDSLYKHFPIEGQGVLAAADPLECVLLNIEACSILQHLVETGLNVPNIATSSAKDTKNSSSHSDDASMSSGDVTADWVNLVVNFLCQTLVGSLEDAAEPSKGKLKSTMSMMPTDSFRSILTVVEKLIRSETFNATHSPDEVRTFNVSEEPEPVHVWTGGSRTRLLKALTMCYHQCSIEGKKIEMCHNVMLRLICSSPRLWRIRGVLDVSSNCWLSLFPKKLWELGTGHPKISRQILDIMSGIFARCRPTKGMSGSESHSSTEEIHRKIAKQFIALFHMEMKNGQQLFGPFILWPLETQLGVVDVLYHMPCLPAELLLSIGVCLSVEVSVDFEVCRRIIDVVHHRRSNSSRANLNNKDKMHDYLDFMFEVILDSKWAEHLRRQMQSTPSTNLKSQKALTKVRRLRKFRMKNITYALRLLSSSINFAHDDFVLEIETRVRDSFRSLLKEVQHSREINKVNASETEAHSADMRGWRCEKLVALLACVRTLKLDVNEKSLRVNTNLVMTSLIEMLTVAGENGDPDLLLQYELFINDSSACFRQPSASADVFICTVKALALQNDVFMSFRLNTLKRVLQLSSLGDHFAEAVQAGAFDDVMRNMERIRQLKGSHTELAENIWSSLQRLKKY